MSVALDLDLNLDLMVGEMPATPCESPHHDNTPGSEHHGDGAFYAITGHACWGPVDSVFIICETYANYWRSQTRVYRCFWCYEHPDPEEYVEIIGAINT